MPAEILESIPEDTRIAYVQGVSFRGPLPPPILFEHYDKTLPGSAERIMRMAEKEQSHRQQWEIAALGMQKSDFLRGQWMGFGLGIAGVAVAMVCAVLDRPYIGTASLATVFAGISAAFFRSRATRSED